MSACPADPGKHGGGNKVAQKEALLELQPGLCYWFKAAVSSACCTEGEQAKGCHGLSQAGQLQLFWRSLSRV